MIPFRSRLVPRALALGLLLPALAFAQPNPTRPNRPAGPRLEAVAETNLLMEGLAQPNFRGLEKMLKDKPADAQAWNFTRGQALIIAETGNLLMLRPPSNQGQEAWFARCAELREAASKLARSAAARDYSGARAGVAEVANACNRCHETFRVPTRITPFAEAQK